MDIKIPLKGAPWSSETVVAIPQGIGGAVQPPPIPVGLPVYPNLRPSPWGSIMPTPTPWQIGTTAPARVPSPWPLPITAWVQNPDKSWTFYWTGTGASVYRIVLNGMQIGFVLASTNPKYTFNLPLNPNYAIYPPPIEIMEGSNSAPSEINSPFTLIQWYQDLTAVTYQLQEFVNGQWTTRQNQQEIGQWVYTVQTPLLTDETTYTYQVLAVGSIQQVSVPLGFQRYVVCPPTFAENSVAVTYSSGNLVIGVPA